MCLDMRFDQSHTSEKLLDYNNYWYYFILLFSLEYWVVPEKIRTPPTDGILEILVGGGVKDPGNPGKRGG